MHFNNKIIKLKCNGSSSHHQQSLIIITNNDQNRWNLSRINPKDPMNKRLSEGFIVKPAKKSTNRRELLKLWRLCIDQVWYRYCKSIPGIIVKYFNQSHQYCYRLIYRLSGVESRLMVAPQAWGVWGRQPPAILNLYSTLHLHPVSEYIRILTIMLLFSWALN